MHHYTLLNIGDTIEGPAPHERYHTVRHFFFDLAVLTETIEGPANPRAQSSSEEYQPGSLDDLCMIDLHEFIKVNVRVGTSLNAMYITKFLQPRPMSEIKSNCRVNLSYVSKGGRTDRLAAGVHGRNGVSKD